LNNPLLTELCHKVKRNQVVAQIPIGPGEKPKRVFAAQRATRLQLEQNRSRRIVWSVDAICGGNRIKQVECDAGIKPNELVFYLPALRPRRRRFQASREFLNRHDVIISAFKMTAGTGSPSSRRVPGELFLSDALARVLDEREKRLQ
jgi:hypothetical protein